ncbi:hypothetical protein DL93DRAFT_2083412, partial [Clavulina sp. PMI_390]
MVMESDYGELLSIGLDQLEFRDSLLSFSIGSYDRPGSMGTSHSKDTNTLTIAWP